MVEHTTTECAFHPLIHDTFDKCWDLPPDLAGVKTKVTDLPIAKWLKHPARGMLWVAILERPTDTALHGACITFDKCWDLPSDLAGVKPKVMGLPIAKWLKHPARGMLWVAIIERPTDQYVTQPYMGHVSLLIPF